MRIMQSLVFKGSILWASMLVAPALADEYPRAEVFGGYQYTRVGAVPGINANGWNAAVTGYATRWFGLTGDFSGAYRSVAVVDLRAHTYTFGPTFVHRGERFSPFAHVLLGGFHASSGTMGFGIGMNGFAMLAGGGVDLQVARRVAVRLFQADWILWRTAGTTEKKNARISVGVVFRIN